MFSSAIGPYAQAGPGFVVSFPGKLAIALDLRSPDIYNTVAIMDAEECMV
jgi:hypothetical protein